jgi:hypothetical protein
MFTAVCRASSKINPVLCSKQSLWEKTIMVPRQQPFGGSGMRVLITFAFVVASALAVAGCFHHQQRVVAEPIAAPPYK